MVLKKQYHSGKSEEKFSVHIFKTNILCWITGTLPRVSGFLLEAARQPVSDIPLYITMYVINMFTLRV